MPHNSASAPLRIPKPTIQPESPTLGLKFKVRAPQAQGHVQQPPPCPKRSDYYDARLARGGEPPFQLNEGATVLLYAAKVSVPGACVHERWEVGHS